MSENALVSVGNDSQLGEVKLAPVVIEVIAGIAAHEVKGVASMRGNFASGVAEKLGKKAHGKGVKVELQPDGVIIDIYAVIDFNASIPEVAQNVQTNIRETLKTMTALDIKEINVHVVGVQMENE